MVRPDPLRDRADEELAVAAVRDPDGVEGRRAACVLLERHTRRVYRWCYGRVQDPALAEDLAQEALLRAYRNLRRFEGWGRFSAWLFVITRNVCIEKLRRPSLLHDAEVTPDMLADPQATADGILEETEEEAALLRLVRENLSDVEQDAIWLRCFEGLSVDAITRILKIEHATGARAVLQTARRKLKAAMKRTERSKP